MYLLLQDADIETTPSVCRLCGLTALNVSCLDTFSESGRHIISVIRKRLEIKIYDKKNPPKSVCQSCIQKVEEWDKFYHNCHKVQQSIMEQSPLIETAGKSSVNHQEAVESSNENASDHLSELVELEGLVQHETAPETTICQEKVVLADPMLLEAKQEETSEVEEDQTEDEFEDAPSTEEEGEEENSDESTNSQPSIKAKRQNKKFIFTIPFLERKVGRSFTQSEKNKLQKLISKRSNTMICNFFPVMFSVIC